ncbi:MAG: hypothetical protein QM790_12330 [Nibricoccus sp.]
MPKIGVAILVGALATFAPGLYAGEKPVDIPKEQQAEIEGLCYSVMMTPYVKENWPDLRSFSIKNVTGACIGKFSGTEAIVGPGACVLTVEVRTRQHGSATLTLSFVAEAGTKYALRPVYRGNAIHATVQNVDTGSFVARTWQTRKSRVHEEPAIVDAP